MKALLQRFRNELTALAVILAGLWGGAVLWRVTEGIFTLASMLTALLVIVVGAVLAVRAFFKKATI